MVDDLRPPLRLLRKARQAEAPALVLVHPVSGDSLAYVPLVAHLAWPGPVIGIDALAPPQTLTGLATDHVRALRAAVRVPFYLAGWNVGGVIAGEMSAQLADAGEPPLAVAIFDARAPQPEMRTRATDDLTLAGHFADLMARAVGGEATCRPASADADALLGVLRDAGALPAGWDPGVVQQRFAVFSSIVRAFFRHEQRHLVVPLALFETQESHPQHPKPPTLGWEPHASTLVRTFIPGTHFTLMSAQYAPRLATIVDEVLPGVANVSR